MKTKVLLTVMLTLCMQLYSSESPEVDASVSKPVILVSPPEMQSFAQAVLNRFNQSSSEFSAELSTNVSEDNLENAVYLMADSQSGSYSHEWKMVIGRDIIVPVISTGNPYFESIRKNGIPANRLSDLANDPEKQVWGTLLGNESKKSVVVYLQEETMQVLGEHDWMTENHLSMNTVESIEELKSKLEQEKAAIVFCKLADLIADQHELPAGIAFLPIDANNNGQLEKIENIYSSYNDFIRGVWIGKYQHGLVRNIYVAANSKPVDEGRLALIKWMLTEGQAAMLDAGINELAYAEMPSKLNALAPLTSVGIQNDQRSAFPWWLIVIAGGIVAILTFELLLRRRRKISSRENSNQLYENELIQAGSMNVPKGIYFDKTHTWVFMERNGEVRMGIDDFLGHVTGSFTRIMMKDEGEQIRRGEPIFTLIRDGKKLTVNAPVSGTIRGVNVSLLSDAEALTRSPYEEGWIYLIEPANWLSELGVLSLAERYKSWIEQEMIRLKDLLAAAMARGNQHPAYVVLQDGGAIVEGALGEMGPDVWEDFQEQFLNQLC
ncbi:glycine cleavage system protein H [Roseimarinus sediminis]|uniref:glycine cleavage system protein H n=1 Tax=Roseimarinus sediminis TaxID=1610899 RepID=UPI003D21CB3A